MSNSIFAGLFSPNDRSLTTCELLNYKNERALREDVNYSKSLRAQSAEIKRPQRNVDVAKKREETERAKTVLRALDDKRWPAHARDSLDAMLDRSEAASSSIVINSPTVSPRGNSLLSRKRECIVLPLSDFPSLNRPSKRSRLHESSPFDTLNVVRHSFVPYPHASSLQTPSLYARESLETSRVTRSHNDCLPRPTVSTSNSPPNDTVESHSPHAEEAAAAAQMEQAGPSFNEDADSHSSHASEPLSFLETDELPLPVKPLFSKISFKKVSSPCIDFTISESEFARSSDVNHVRLKRLLGKPSSKDESNLLKSILKKPPTELAASIAPSFAPVNPGIYSSPSQDAPVLKLSSSIPAFPAASSFASNPEPNIFTATPLTSGSRPTSLSNARRKFARR